MMSFGGAILKDCLLILRGGGGGVDTEGVGGNTVASEVLTSGGKLK